MERDSKAMLMIGMSMKVQFLAFDVKNLLPVSQN